jgi:hypothetical protein
MVSEEILITQIVTIALSIVALIVSLKLLSNYKKTEVGTALLLSIYSFFIFLAYLFAFLLRFPSSEVNLAEKSMIVPLVVFVSLGFQAFFALLFVVDMFRPFKQKWIAVPIALILVYFISIAFGPPVKVPTSPGIYEWTSSAILNKTSVIPVLMAYTPVGFLAFYSIKMPRKEDKARGLLLLAGFFMIATFSNFFDHYGIVPPILPVRRILIAVGIVILYWAFVRYKWIR